MSLPLKSKQHNVNDITNVKIIHNEINIITMLAYKILKHKYSKYLVFSLLSLASFSFLGVYILIKLMLNKFSFAFINLEQAIQNNNYFNNSAIILNFINAWGCFIAIFAFVFLLCFSVITLFKCFKIFCAFNQKNFKIK